MDTGTFRRLRAEGRLPPELTKGVAHSDMGRGHPPDRELMTVDEFASWLRSTPSAARSMIRRGQLPAGAVVRIGRRVRIRTAIVRDWVLKSDVA